MFVKKFIFCRYYKDKGNRTPINSKINQVTTIVFPDPLKILTPASIFNFAFQNDLRNPVGKNLIATLIPVSEKFEELLQLWFLIIKNMTQSQLVSRALILTSTLGPNPCH